MRIVFLSLLFLAAGCSGQSRFEKACEAEITNRLKAPSTYKRVQSYTNKEELILNDFVIEWLRTQPDDAGWKELEDVTYGEKNGPVLYSFAVTYDASNSYGVPIRGSALCEYASMGGSLSAMNERSVRVDGLTRQERRLEVLRENYR